MKYIPDKNKIHPVFHYAGLYDRDKPVVIMRLYWAYLQWSEDTGQTWKLQNILFCECTRSIYF